MLIQEQSEGTWRPDLTARLRNGATLYIETFVTHTVEERKATALDNLMEIDLSRLSPEEAVNSEALRQAVLKQAPRHWFRCSLYDDLPAVRRACAADIPAEQARRNQAAEKRQLESRR